MYFVSPPEKEQKKRDACSSVFLFLFVLCSPKSCKEGASEETSDRGEEGKGRDGEGRDDSGVSIFWRRAEGRESRGGSNEEGACTP